MKMENNRINKWLAVAAMIAGLVLTSTVNADEKTKTRVLKFDVVEDTSRFVFAKEPVFPDGMPAYGNSFVTQGYIYPRGFLDQHEGVTADGKPTHPEKVIGVWTCRGYFVGNGAHSTTGPMVITTQTYDLFDEPGYTDGKFSTSKLLISEGYELIDENVQFSRAITGGTGPFSRARGEVIQTLLGFNQYMGVRVRFTVKVMR